MLERDSLMMVPLEEQQQHGPAIPIIMIAATVAAGAMSAVSAIQAGNAQSKAADYQAQVAKNNATIASSNAAYAEEAGASQQQASAMQTRAEVGSAVAAQAGSGLDVNSGSAVQVRSSDAALGELTGLNIKNNAARQAYGYTTQQSNFTADAGMDEATGANAKTASIIGAASSILGSAGQLGSGVSKFQTTGVNLGGARSVVS